MFHPRGITGNTHPDSGPTEKRCKGSIFFRDGQLFHQLFVFQPCFSPFSPVLSVSPGFPYGVFVSSSPLP